MNCRSALSKSGKTALLASINELMDRVSISTVMQDQQLGLGDAVLRGQGARGR